MAWFDFKKTEVKTKLGPLEAVSVEIYIFGSALWKEEPNDLDILMVYEKNTKISEVKSNLEPDVAGKKIHITALTVEEMAEDNEFTNHVKKSRFLIYDQSGWKI